MRQRKANVKVVARIAAPVSLAAVATSWMQSSGPAILTYFSNNIAGNLLGSFVILLTLGRFVHNIIMTISRSIFPYLVKWNTEGDRKRTRQYLNLMLLYVLVGYGVLVIGALFFGGTAIGIVFGKDYMASAKYLPLAFMTFCTFSLCNVYRISLYSIKLPGLFLILNLGGILIYFLLLIVGNYLLNVKDLFYLLFFAMAFSNLSVVLGCSFFSRLTTGIPSISGSDHFNRSKGPIDHSQSGQT